MPENHVTDPITDQKIASGHPTRDRVLDRLWELADLGPEITRGSISGQVKALSMIIAIEGLIPDRRAASARNKPAPPPVTADIYEAAWLRAQRGESVDPEPSPAPAQEEPTPEPIPVMTEPPVVAAPVSPSPTPSLAPRVPMADYVAPDTRVPFSITKNRFGRHR